MVARLTSHLAVRIEPERLAHLQEVAEAHELTVAQVIRILVDAADDIELERYYESETGERFAPHEVES